MITAVDSNILIDIFGADAQFGHLSAKMLQTCMTEGAIYACEVVWSEVATVFPNEKNFLNAMDTLGIEFSPLLKDSALLAAQAWRRYRENGGKRDRVVADFLIGAHAKKQTNRLLTRYRGFYRNYFKNLIILDIES